MSAVSIRTQLDSFLFIVCHDSLVILQHGQTPLDIARQCNYQDSSLSNSAFTLGLETVPEPF